MIWHALDGNMIAADAHHGQDRPEDFHECDMCAAGFMADEHDAIGVEQHPRQWSLCKTCGDEWEDEQ